MEESRSVPSVGRLREKLGQKPRPFRTAFFVVAKFWLLMLS